MSETQQHSSRRNKDAGPGASRGPRLSGGSMLLLAVLALAAALLVPTTQQLIRQRQHITELQQDILTTQQQIDQVNAEVDRWNDPAYIRAQARGRLLFAQPGDTTYVVINPPSRPVSDADLAVSRDLHETNTGSVELFLSSLIAAVGPNANGTAASAKTGEQDANPGTTPTATPTATPSG